MSNSKNVVGIIVKIHIERAFDSISWEFIEKSLQIFNFGKGVRKWVQCQQKKIKVTKMQVKDVLDSEGELVERTDLNDVYDI